MRRERVISIDYLKAFFSVCVVLVHLDYVSPSLIFYKDRYLEHIFTVSDFINFYVLLLAVPVFFIISNYLFLLKSNDKNVVFSILKRIGNIALFWIIIDKLFTYKRWEIVHWFPGSISEIPGFIASGGHTLYYFFVSLIVLTIITHISRSIKLVYIGILFAASTLLVFVLPLLSITTGNFILSVYWYPLNFLPYPFAAIIVFYLSRLHSTKINIIYFIFVGLLITLSVLVDWTIYVNEGFFSVNAFAIPAYTRPSLVLISMTLLYLATRINLKKNSVVQFMSNNSLALYCIHPFFIGPANKLTGNNNLVSLIIVIILSYVTAKIMGNFIQQKLFK